MQSLFRFFSPTVYFPIPSVTEHGELIEPDGVDVLDAVQAAARLGAPPELLDKAWAKCFAIDEERPADSDRIIARDRFIDLAFRGMDPDDAEKIKAMLRARGLLDAFVCREVWLEPGESGYVLCTTIQHMLAIVRNARLLSGGISHRLRAANGDWLEHWDDPHNHPYECEATCNRVGDPLPISAKRLRHEVYRESWYHDTMPVESFKKCSSAHVLRHAFPDRLGSLYLKDEIVAAKPAAKLKLADERKADEDSQIDVNTEEGTRAFMSGRSLSTAQQDKLITATREKIRKELAAKGIEELEEGAAFWMAVRANAIAMSRGKRRRG